MPHPFVPLTLLLLVPAAYLAARWGVLEQRWFRWVLAAAAAVVVALSIAAGGVDFVHLNRVKLLLAAATTIVLALRAGGVRSVAIRTPYRTTLVVLAALALVVYLNFLGFHATGATRTYIHLHDVAHYYLGAKYAREIGYMDLYIAIVRAESERTDTPFAGREVRDLRSNRLVDVRTVLEDGAPVKAHFTPARWSAFQHDVSFFRDSMGPQFTDILLDHGYNPTPLWTLLGSMLANLVPAGNRTGIFLLTCIDPMLQGLLFVAVGLTFGVETALLSMLYMCVLFGASFGWVGGAFMRSLWLFAVVVGVCCLPRGRIGTAAALFSGAALLRIFPAVFLVALGCKTLTDAAAARYLTPPLRRLLLASATVAVVLFIATAAAPRGLASWASFQDNMQRHVENTAFNTIGLTPILVQVGAMVTPDAGSPEAEAARRRVVYLVQLCTIVPLALIWFVRRSRQETLVNATVMGIVLLYVGLNLACYYYLVLMLLIIANRDRPDRLALIFAVEVATYTLQLFEDRDAVVFFYRNVLVGLLLVALYAKPMHRMCGES